ncbi:MAG: endonuclease domain-containing protein, partial [Rickettsiales bacterium]|nr:endonuclease domain-containing protein [Rickettsiales bacterium]
MILVIDTSSSGIGLALEGASPNLVSTKNTHESSPPVEGCGNAAGWFSQARNSQRYYNLPFNPDLTERAKENRKSGSLPEALFWNQLKNKQLLGLDFDRQKIIGNYIVDFFCASIGLVIEIDDKTSHE